MGLGSHLLSEVSLNSSALYTGDNITSVKVTLILGRQTYFTVPYCEYSCVFAPIAQAFLGRKPDQSLPNSVHSLTRNSVGQGLLVKSLATRPSRNKEAHQSDMKEPTG